MHAFAFLRMNLRLTMSLSQPIVSNKATAQQKLAAQPEASQHVVPNFGASKLDITQEILRNVEAIKQGSGFGSIEIILHEGRVTQIERREKQRFNQNLGWFPTFYSSQLHMQRLRHLFTF